MATIKDVAREAGVAQSTVSKYLNGGSVREENRRLIDRAVEKLNYKVNFHARVMRRGSSGMVLVMVPQFDDGYCCEVMQKAREVLLENGYIAVLAESGGDQKKEKEILQRAIAHQAEGVITLQTEMNLPEYEELQRRNIPLVIIGRTYNRHNAGCVYFDDGEKFTKMFRRLKAHGHSRIGVVGGGLDRARLHSREFAYYLGLFGKAGLDIDDRYIYVKSGTAVETGVEAAEYFLNMAQPPTAIVCLNADTLLGVYITLRERGICVPDEMSLCVLARRSEYERMPYSGFDAVVQPIREATERAVNLLLDNIHSIAQGKSSSRTTVMMQTELRTGNTIGPVSGEPKTE